MPQTGALTNYANPTISGAPKGTRTPDLLLRRQLLYPAELLAQTLQSPDLLLPGIGAGDGNRTHVFSLEG